MKYKFKHRFFRECKCGNRISASVSHFDTSEQEIDIIPLECYICGEIIENVICRTEATFTS